MPPTRAIPACPAWPPTHGPAATTRPPPPPTPPPGPGWSPGSSGVSRPGSLPLGPPARPASWRSPWPTPAAAGATTAASFLDPGPTPVGHLLSRRHRRPGDPMAAWSGRPQGRGQPRPRELALGTYPVVLEPNAASVLVQWLGWLGFGAKAYDEGRSFLVGRLGQRVCSPWSRWWTTPPRPTPSGSGSTSRASPNGASP